MHAEEQPRRAPEVYQAAKGGAAFARGQAGAAQETPSEPDPERERGAEGKSKLKYMEGCWCLVVVLRLRCSFQTLLFFTLCFKLNLTWSSSS